MAEIADLLRHANPAVLIVTVVFGSWAMVAIVALLARQWRRVRQAEIDAALKHKMLDQGMSADEIVRVLRASSAPETAERAGWATNRCKD